MLPFLVGSPIFLDASLFKLEPPLLGIGGFFMSTSRRKEVAPIFWRKAAAFAPNSALTLNPPRP